jgi:hypothetical protein
MSYEDARATKMLATHCVCCGRLLVDATSVELGIGPECRKGDDGGIPDAVRVEANGLVYAAALAADQGRVGEVVQIAGKIRELGLDTLASKVGRRFKSAERKASIVIDVVGDCFSVKTPFRRGDKDAFIAAWRKIPGRRYQAGRNLIPVAQKAALWALLREFFGGKYGKGPKGTFRIPQPEAKPEQVQMDLGNQAELELAKAGG